MFDLYLAIGDSMSIDYYPYRDVEKLGIDVRQDIGAAALLYKNESKLFPDFKGRDLVTKFPGLTYQNPAFDGATTEDLLTEVRIEDLLKAPPGRTLVTVTLGGNDLLQVLRRTMNLDPQEMMNQYSEILVRYEKIIDTIERVIPDRVLILTTVFDPTDGTGVMPTKTPMYGDKKLPLQYLDNFNSFVKYISEKRGALLADVYTHFKGHGAECNKPDSFWYWTNSPIEPSFQGASEIRRVWLDTLDRYLSLETPKPIH